MNSDEKWRRQFEQLAHTLGDRPRLRSRVVEQIEARTEQQMLVVEARWPVKLSRRHVVHAAVVGLSLAVAVILVVLILPGLSRPAFAQVQSALRKIQTAVITREFPDRPGVSVRLLVSSRHDLYRMEWNDGAVVIQSREGRNLTLNTKEKLAQMTPGAGFGLEGERLAPGDFLGRLQSVRADAVRDLGRKKFEGRELDGFELPPERGMRRRVWVDTDSHLPVLEEITPAVAKLTDDDPRIVTLRPPRSTVTYEFNVELTDGLFSLDPPDGYVLVDASDFKWPGRELSRLPDDLDAASYVLIPGQGIGLARFGMSKQEVIAAFGKPDAVNLIGERNDEQKNAEEEISRKAKEKNWDHFRVNRELDRLNQSQSLVRTSEALMYQSLGFHVVVRDDTGMDEIMCWPKGAASQQFVGAMDLGVSMQSSPADVKRVYGEPTKAPESENSLGLYYEKLQLRFGFDGNGVMQSIHLTRPKQN